jgi:hypothetical protein
MYKHLYTSICTYKHLYAAICTHKHLHVPIRTYVNVYAPILMQTYVCIQPTGPPRYSSLFKFERANLYLKQLLKNASNGLPSIFKNYLISEYVSICIGTSLNNIAAMKDVLKDMPHDLNLFMHAPPAYLSSIHVDYNDNAPTVYTVQSSRINELRGRC